MSEIIIRAMREADIPAALAIHNTPSVGRNLMAVPYESSARWRKQWADGPPGNFVVACVDGEVVGQAGLHVRKAVRRAHAAGCGIMVAAAWQSRGVGTALFAALTDLADNWLNLCRLELEVFTDNAAAIRLYRKFGFVVEGTLAGDAFRDGAFADTLLMARLHGTPPVDTGAYPAHGARAPDAAVSMRAAEPEDAGGIDELMNQPLVRHGTLRIPYGHEAESRFLAAPDDAQRRSIVAMAMGAVVGLGLLQCGLRRRAHCGYVQVLAVHDAWQGRGIGAALLAAMLDVADNWLNLRRVGLEVIADNATAIRLYERFGFVTEARKRADVFRAGAYADGLVMARLK